MEIHFVEYHDIVRGGHVIQAYTKVGEREIRSQMRIAENCHQNYIDFAYCQLKDKVRNRALNEMRVQQIALVRFVQWERRSMQKHIKPKEIHDWKKEGF